MMLLFNTFIFYMLMQAPAFADSTEPTDPNVVHIQKALNKAQSTLEQLNNSPAMSDDCLLKTDPIQMDLSLQKAFIAKPSHHYLSWETPEVAIDYQITLPEDEKFDQIRSIPQGLQLLNPDSSLDPSRPTIVYVPDAIYREPIPQSFPHLKKWIDSGYNVLIFHWEHLSYFEETILDMDENTPYHARLNADLAASLLEEHFNKLKAKLGTDYQQEIRLVGAGLGAIPATQLAAKPSFTKLGRNRLDIINGIYNYTVPIPTFREVPIVDEYQYRPHISAGGLSLSQSHQPISERPDTRSQLKAFINVNTFTTPEYSEYEIQGNGWADNRIQFHPGSFEGETPRARHQQLIDWYFASVSEAKHFDTERPQITAATPTQDIQSGGLTLIHQEEDTFSQISSEVDLSPTVRFTLIDSLSRNAPNALLRSLFQGERFTLGQDGTSNIGGIEVLRIDF